jgi:ABC-type proline/glycine betaine transport system ATPase subunit
VINSSLSPKFRRVMVLESDHLPQSDEKFSLNRSPQTDYVSDFTENHS